MHKKLSLLLGLLAFSIFFSQQGRKEQLQKQNSELETILFVVHDVTELKLIEQEIKEKNKKISDSINYAQRIQTSILPDTRVLQHYFPRSFIFYRP